MKVSEPNKAITTGHQNRAKSDEQQHFFQMKKVNDALDHGQASFFSPNGKGLKQPKPFFAGVPVQTKLTVGQPGDKYEQEADSMADQVVQRLAEDKSNVELNPKPETQNPKLKIQRKPIFESDAAPELQAKPINGHNLPLPIIQSKSDTGGREDELQQKEDLGEEEQLQMKPIFESDASPPDEDTLQMASSDNTANTSNTNSDLESSLLSSKGGGSPLPKDTRSEMEGTFGADFSGVQVHTGGEAVQMNKQLGAQAFTHGSDIYFNEGKYDTGSTGGKTLLAHELTHTVQQGGSKVIQKKLEADEKPPNTVKNGTSTIDKANPKSLDSQIKPKQQEEKNKQVNYKPEGENKLVKSKTPTAEEIKGKRPKEIEKKESGEKNSNNNQNPENNKKAKKSGKRLKAFKKELKKNPSNFQATTAPPQEFEPLPTLSELLNSSNKTQEENLGEDEDLLIQRVPSDNQATPPVNPEPQGDISSEYISQISSSKESIASRLEENAQSLNFSIEVNVLSLRGLIVGSILNAVSETRGKFIEARNFVRSSILNTETTLTNDLNAKIEEARTEGNSIKEEIQMLFGQHDQNIDETINGKIEASDDMRIHYQEYMHTRVSNQILEATTRGRRKAATYSNTEKGRKQKSAVMNVANDTADEMSAKKPETIEAIAVIIEPIPDEFRSKGQEAKDGLGEHRETIMGDIDQRIEEVISQLTVHHQSSLVRLRELAAGLNNQLDEQEVTAVTQIEQLQPLADSQIEDARQTSVNGLEESKEKAQNQIYEKADEAIALLQNGDNSNPEIVREFGESILSFMEGSVTNAIQILSEGAVQMEERINQIQANVQETLSIFLQNTDQALLRFRSYAEGTLNTLIESFDQGLSAIFDSMVASFDELVSQVQSQLDTSIDDLENDTDGTLLEAEGKIVEAIDEGLAQNVEALEELDEKMNEAAEDAAWRHDHPILAGLADIGSFIGGLVLGILAVLALVIIVIVAFKLIIAGLVALGISLAVAKLIVLVAGLALLAYGIYQAYQARIDRGSEGGWGTFGLAILDLTGITTIYEGATAEGLSAFDRGYLIGQGIATLATFFVGRRINNAISSRLPRGITNPTRGSFLHRFRGGRSTGTTSTRPGGIENRGYRPQPGERSMTRQQYRQQHRQQRMQGRGLERRGYRPRSGERSSTREQYRQQQRRQRMEGQGLERRGYRPRPGERSMTREQYRHQQSQQRQRQRLRGDVEQSRVNADQYIQSAQHAQNRAAAWARYRGRYSYQRWRRSYDTLTRNRIVGRLTEEAFRRISRGTPRTERGIRISGRGRARTRYIDSARGNLAQEVKSGPLRDSRFIRNQIAKDLVLMQRRGYQIEWHLFQGGDQNLINFMRANGFTVIVY